MVVLKKSSLLGLFHKTMKFFIIVRILLIERAIHILADSKEVMKWPKPKKCDFI